MPMTSTTITTKAPVKAATPVHAPAAPVKAATPAPAAPVPKTYSLRTPVTSNVTAIQYLGHPDAAGTFAGHLTREDPMHQMTVVLVQTADGGQPAFPGDWIVTDSKGNESVMKDVDFYARYAVDAPVAAAKPPVPAPVAVKSAAPAPILAKPTAPTPVAAKPPAPIVPKPVVSVKEPTPHILT